MDGEWTIGARLAFGIFGAIFGALSVLYLELHFSVFDLDAVNWMLVGISAGVCFILASLFGPKFFEFFE